MAIQRGVWGIDLGQCALKALRLEVIDDKITATAFDYVEHPKILSQPDADPDQLTREALEKFLERNTLRGDQVAISVPGQSGLARFVKLPPVEEKKIPDIVRFEAKQQIPFNLDEVVWDYQKIGVGAVSDGFAMETEIGLFAIKRDTVNRYLQHFKDVGVEVHLVQMSPLALCNFVSFDLLNKGGDAPTAAAEDEEEDEDSAGKKKCVVALDIGTDNSNLVITDGERIIWQRPIPLGGNHFTRALTKDLKLTFAKAEHLKRNATKSPDLKKILLALRPVLNDFVGEVQRSLSYFTNTHKDAHVKYMVGLGNAFRLPGLQKFLAEKLQLDVRKLGKMNRLSGDSVVSAPAYAENVLSFAVAYGLALQGLGKPRLQTNLLPHEIRFDRLIRAKKPWAVAAAAALLFGASTMTLGYAMQHRAYAHPDVGEAIKEGERVRNRASGYESTFKTKEDEIKKNEAAVRSILAGSNERTNWLEFMKFVSEALPSAPYQEELKHFLESSNLRDPEAKRYLTGSAQLASQKFIAQQTGSGQPADKDDEEDLEHLVQVNVVSLLSLYTDNLEGFFSKVKADRDASWDSMLKSDQDKAPTGPGWVVELRGYTYHHDDLQFLRLALVRNLATYRMLDAPGGAATTPPKNGGTPTPVAPTPPPMPPGGGAATGTEGEKKGNLNDPVWGNVSHVILYRAWRDYNPQGQNFGHIGTSLVGSLVGAGSLGGGGEASLGGDPGMITPGGGGRGSVLRGGGGDSPGDPAGGGAAGTGAGRREGWTPLAAVNLQGSGGAAASGGASGESILTPPGGRGLPELGTLGGVGTVEGGGTTVAGKPPAGKKKLTRTEFVILFVWREPLPSDELLGIGGAAPDAAPGGVPAGGATPPGSGDDGRGS